MPCYLRAANRLGVQIPQNVDPEKIEDYLMKVLDIKDKVHEKLRAKIEELTAQDPEQMKALLERAFENKENEKKESGPPDRLSKMRNDPNNPYRRRVVEVEAEAQ